MHILGLLICNFFHVSMLCKEESDVFVLPLCFHTLSKPVSTRIYFL